ncbi:MAG: hypothetical protein MZV49_05050 [Rhodopseudomonas palustris]|nr:hypothetical protein [Rhodopseudomonas palustris]
MQHIAPAIGLPSFDLPNTGTQFHLAGYGRQNAFASCNMIISWYKDDTKSDGGWSLEMIDPIKSLYEQKKTGWHPSHAEGGTPGTGKFCRGHAWIAT